MADKELKLILKVDSKSGEAVIKKLKGQLKSLEKVSFGKDLSKGTSAAAKDMEKLAKEAEKAAEEYRKITDASKVDAERLKKEMNMRKSFADADIKNIAEASKADSDRLKKSITEEKQRVAERNKAQSEAIRMEKQRIVDIDKVQKEAAAKQKQHIDTINKERSNAARIETRRANAEIRQIAEASKADAERYRKIVKDQRQAVAAINRSHGEAIRMEDKRTAAIEKQNKAIKRQAGFVNKIKSKLFALRSYWLAISAAVAIATITVVKFFKASFMSVEKFKLSVASIAASITTFSDLSAGNVDEVYANAAKYAEKLALKMEIINARTIASGTQITAMLETFIQQRVLLSASSKEQEDAFVAIANAVSLITQGQNQEIQMRQEIRGLLSGDIRATNLLARMIDTKLGGTLKENLAIWKQQGTVIVELGKHLEGFKAGSADLASTWAAVSTTFETIGNRYLRGMFQPLYAELIKNSLSFSRSLLGQKEILGSTGRILRDELVMAWGTIKSTAIGVFNVVDGFKEPLLAMLKLTNMILHGWALIFEHVTNIAVTLKDKALTKEGVMSWLEPLLKTIGYEGDFVLSTPLGEGGAVEEEGEEPKLLPAKDASAEEDYWKKVNELDREYQRERIKLDYEGFEQRRKLLQLETDYLVAEHKGALDIIEMIKKVHHVKMGQIDKAAIKQRIDDEEDLRKKREESAKEELENRERVIRYISTERQNKVRDIFQEAEALKYFANSQEELNKIAAVATEKLTALETEAAAKRKKNHEQVLQFISTEMENKTRAIDTERDKLLELATTYGEMAAIYEESALRKQELNALDLTAMEEWAETSISLMEQVEAVSIRGAESFSSGFSDAFVDFMYGTKTAKEAITSFAITFFSQITRMIIQQLLLNALKEIMGTTSTTASAKAVAGNAAETASVAALTSSYIALAAAKALAGVAGAAGGGATVAEKGMVVSNGQTMTAYARGGVVDTPTLFPMKNGTGLMGEAGPEAIMPLKRGKDGKLGVESSGEKDVQVMPQEVNIVNVFNPNMFDEYLSSSKGQEAIINVIGNRTQAVKRVLR